MQPLPYDTMICDSDLGDGGVYFYEEYFEWLNRKTGEGFRIHYKDVDDVKVLSGLKKTVIVTTKSGETRKLYLYRAETLRKMIYDAANKVGSTAPAIEEKPAEVKEDTLAQLERLAKLHDSGALSDEEFAKAKQKILG